MFVAITIDVHSLSFDVPLDTNAAISALHHVDTIGEFDDDTKLTNLDPDIEEFPQRTPVSKVLSVARPLLC